MHSWTRVCGFGLNKPLLYLEVKLLSKPCGDRLLFGVKKVLLLRAWIASFVVDAIFLRFDNISGTSAALLR